LERYDLAFRFGSWNRIFLGSAVLAWKLRKFYLKAGENVCKNGHHSGSISKFICTSTVAEVSALLEVVLSVLRSFYIQANRLAAKGKVFQKKIKGILLMLILEK